MILINSSTTVLPIRHTIYKDDINEDNEKHEVSYIMKITDPEVIKNGEKDLIDAVQEDLDTEAVKEILKERLAVAKMASKGGQIVVHENQIAFRLDFEVNLSGSLLFDRDGNFIDDRPDSSQATLDPDMNDTGLTMPEDEEISLTDGLPDMDDDLPEKAFSYPEPDSSGQMDKADGQDAPDMDEDPELSIDLPEYDMDDDLDLPDADLDLAGMDDGDNLLMDDDDDLDINDDDDLDLTDDQDEEDAFNGDLDAQDLDDDINDILKESREFWEQKKE